MFPADTLISSYVEDQTAAFEAKRRATEKTSKQTKLPTTKTVSNTTSPSTTRPSTPASNQSQMIKPGVLGNLWQGFFKPVNPNTVLSASSSAASSPTMEKSEQEAYAERMRDIDICAMRAW